MLMLKQAQTRAVMVRVVVARGREMVVKARAGLGSVKEGAGRVVAGWEVVKTVVVG
jgi:hypothetical protein